MRILSSSLIGFLFLAACAVGPDYSRPNLATPEKFRMTEALQEAESFAKLVNY